MSDYAIAPGVPAALRAFTLPEKLGFGQVNAPVMFSAEWQDGDWGAGRLLPYGPIEVWPGSRVLHYPIAPRLREALLSIQERRAPDPFHWVHEVAPSGLHSTVSRHA